MSMFERVELKTSPEVKRVVTAAFPDYRKKNAVLVPFSNGVNINSYWDGGSKSEFAIVELSTMTRRPLPSSTHPYFEVVRPGMANQTSEYFESDHVGNITLKILPAGFALVQAGTCCGKPATAYVYLNPDNLAKLLPAGDRQ